MLVSVILCIATLRCRIMVSLLLLAYPFRLKHLKKSLSHDVFLEVIVFLCVRLLNFLVQELS